MFYEIDWLHFPSTSHRRRRVYSEIVGVALRGHPLRWGIEFFRRLRSRSDGAATECRPYNIRTRPGLTASGAHYYHRGSGKCWFGRLQNEGGGINANHATICSLSDVAEALRIFSFLDFPRQLSSEFAKRAKQQPGFSVQPD